MTIFGHLVCRFFLILFISVTASDAVVLVPNLPDSGILAPDNRGIIDSKVDYEKFSGRVTDKDDTSRILKIQVENNNTKFLRVGDLVLFKVNLRDDRQWCKAFVRGTEDFYFTVYVESFAPCFSSEEYFRRGTVLNFFSKVLAERIFEASMYREQLIVRKEDFLRQLNDINHFLWTYDQQKVKTAAEYDARINELAREKRKALDDMITHKQERLVLQGQLMLKLNELDESLKFYRVERQELMTDRWEADHDHGLPFGQRPQNMRH